jgi:hypothetical protein
MTSQEAEIVVRARGEENDHMTDLSGSMFTSQHNEQCLQLHVSSGTKLCTIGIYVTCVCVKIFPLASTASRPALESTQPPIQFVLRGEEGGSGSCNEVNQSLPSDAEV